MKTIDITGQKLVALRDVQDALSAGATRVLIADSCVVTPSARDFLAQHNMTSSPAARPVPQPSRLTRVPPPRPVAYGSSAP